MKIVIRTLLCISIAVLGYFCVMSILTPIEFNEQSALREKAVVKNLIDLRKAQIEYKNQTGKYAVSADTLIKFIKNGQMPVVLKVGTLTDQQLNDGLTEAKAIAIVRKGNQKEIIALGLQNFKRDTSYVSVYESLFKDSYSIDEVDKIFEIPYSNGQRFQIDTATYTNPTSGIQIPLFEAKAHYDTYLSDLNRQELINLKDTKDKLGKYPGLQVGSIVEPNNNAGNWE